MPRLDGKGPEGNGPKTGRKLGRCKEPEEITGENKLGTGLGKRRKSGGGKGRGERLKSGFIPKIGR